MKAGHSVVFSTLADLIASLAKAERDGTLHERIRYLSRASLLVVDEIGYLPVVPGGGNLFFQLVNARYEKSAMILTSNRGFAEWGEVFGDPVVGTALLDRLLHQPSSSRSKARAIVFVSTPTSCPSTCARKPSSHRHRRHDAAVAHQERPQPITTTADHQKPPTRQSGEFWKPTIAETSVPVDS